MQTELEQIGARITGLRDILEITPVALAEALNIPVTTLLAYERGETDIPVSCLYSIAKVLRVELSTLLTGDEPRVKVYSVVRKGHGAPVERRKAYAHEALAPHFIDKQCEPFLVTVAPGASDVPCACNVHEGQEFNYVLQGTVKLTIAGHDVVLNEGDAIYFDSGQPHGMQALGSGPAQFLAVIL
jgi:quercetin dioxygenase-like cupin family protein